MEAHYTCHPHKHAEREIKIGETIEEAEGASYTVTMTRNLTINRKPIVKINNLSTRDGNAFSVNNTDIL